MLEEQAPDRGDFGGEAARHAGILALLERKRNLPANGGGFQDFRNEQKINDLADQRAFFMDFWREIL
jgi:hypothetical protein